MELKEDIESLHVEMPVLTKIHQASGQWVRSMSKDSLFSLQNHPLGNMLGIILRIKEWRKYNLK